jgi:hypothetical protein
MTLSLEMSADDVSALTSMLPASLLGPTTGLAYDGEILTVPDGALTSAVKAIMADTSWLAAAARARLKAHAGEKRFATETGGITANGISIPTDRMTQAQLTGAYNYLQVVPSATINWKLADGTFVNLNAAAITAIATAVAAHVQACFAAEASLAAGIDASPPTITTTAQIDVALAAV